MPRDFECYLQDILDAIEKIEAYTATMGRRDFENNSKTVDAVLRNLEVIGEAAKCVPEAIRQQHHKIQWRKIADLRDILIHRYFGVNMEIVWDILQNKLAGLALAVREIQQGQGK